MLYNSTDKVIISILQQEIKMLRSIVQDQKNIIDNSLSHLYDLSEPHFEEDEINSKTIDNKKSPGKTDRFRDSIYKSIKNNPKALRELRKRSRNGVGQATLAKILNRITEDAHTDLVAFEIIREFNIEIDI